MSDFPRTEAERESKRLTYLEVENQHAQQRAQRNSLSMRCARGDHGCMNDGSNCLCRCHDQRLDGTPRWPAVKHYAR